MAERGTFILHFLRSSLLARPYSASLRNLAPSHNHHVCSFDSFQSLHRHCHCPAPALVSKVTLGILVEKFGYLISYRGVRQLSPSLFLFLYLSELLALAILFHVLLALPSLMPRGRPFLFARNDRSFRALYIVRCEITLLREKGFVACDSSCGTHMYN